MERLKNLIAKKKKTNIEVASLIGKSNQTITNWISGYRTPDLKDLEALSQALDIEISELLSTGPGYAHFYHDQTGEYLGIRKI